MGPVEIDIYYFYFTVQKVSFFCFCCFLFTLNNSAYIVTYVSGTLYTLESIATPTRILKWAVNPFNMRPGVLPHIL